MLTNHINRYIRPFKPKYFLKIGLPKKPWLSSYQPNKNNDNSSKLYRTYAFVGKNLVSAFHRALSHRTIAPLQNVIVTLICLPDMIIFKLDKHKNQSRLNFVLRVSMTEVRIPMQRSSVSRNELGVHFFQCFSMATLI